jgi:hypothetical protein
MFDPNRSNEPQGQRASSARERPVARGFGEFSGAYRARWTLSHPDMQTRWPADKDSASQLRALPGAPGADQRPEPETSSGDRLGRDV